MQTPIILWDAMVARLPAGATATYPPGAVVYHYCPADGWVCARKPN